MTMITATPALALEFEVSDKTSGEFSKATSIETTQTIGEINIYETDVSKNSSYIPPLFGSPSADTPKTGELLTPNIADKTAYTGTVLNTVSNSSASSDIPPSPVQINYSEQYSDKFTLPDNLYYSGGSIGTLKIPSINLSVKVYETESLESLAKGAGHFKSTSCWDGNIGIAGHNRGVTNHFGKIHTLKQGDKITYTTKLGTRTYKVKTVIKINDTDYSYLQRITDNKITLITCVENVPSKRWCIQAVEVK